MNRKPETEEFLCKVSSTINKDVKLFGKHFMFDGEDTTCWNSDEGEIQWIQLSYKMQKEVSVIHIQFQGGFAAEKCNLEIWNDGIREGTETLSFKNDNLYQVVKLSQRYNAKTFRFIFNKLFDTYGRIVVYHLKLESE